MKTLQDIVSRFTRPTYRAQLLCSTEYGLKIVGPVPIKDKCATFEAMPEDVEVQSLQIVDDKGEIVFESEHIGREVKKGSGAKVPIDFTESSPADLPVPEPPLDENALDEVELLLSESDS